MEINIIMGIVHNIVFIFFQSRKNICQFIESVKKSIKKCEHGKHKAYRKDCGGSGICVISFFITYLNITLLIF